MLIFIVNEAIRLIGLVSDVYQIKEMSNTLDGQRRCGSPPIATKGCCCSLDEDRDVFSRNHVEFVLEFKLNI